MWPDCFEQLRTTPNSLLVLSSFAKEFINIFFKKCLVFLVSSAAFHKGLWTSSPDLVVTTDLEKWEQRRLLRERSLLGATNQRSDCSGVSSPDTRLLLLHFHTAKKLRRVQEKRNFTERYCKGPGSNGHVYLRGGAHCKRLYSFTNRCFKCLTGSGSPGGRIESIAWLFFLPKCQTIITARPSMGMAPNQAEGLRWSFWAPAYQMPVRTAS